MGIGPSARATLILIEPTDGLDDPNARDDENWNIRKTRAPKREELALPVDSVRDGCCLFPAASLAHCAIPFQSLGSRFHPLTMTPRIPRPPWFRESSLESHGLSLSPNISRPKRRVRAPGLQESNLRRCRPGALTRRSVGLSIGV